MAVAGRSARSYTREGRFSTIAGLVKSGDYVIIEFGHNDGGSLTTTDNGRTDCAVVNSNYDTTCTSVYEWVLPFLHLAIHYAEFTHINSSGVTETVLTYPKYLENAANLMIAKGASVILSSPTVDNPWETGTFVYSTSRFVGYASDAAASTGSTFVNHELYLADVYYNEGATTVDSYYPNDHTHTSPTGANVVARAFILGLEATSSSLNSYVTND